MKLSRIALDSVLLTASSILGLSISASANKRSNPAQQSTSKTSTAQVDIQNGGLSLDDTPNFSFTNQGSDDEYRLHLADQGSKDNQIHVTDYRNEDDTNDSHRPGWRLNVSAGHLAKGFQLRLGNQEASNASDYHPVTLSADRPSQEIMGSDIHDTGHPHQGYGENTITFDHPSDAYLIVPNVPPKRYAVNVHWEMDSQVNSDVNDAR